VAIDNARLLAETRSALAELSTANRLIRAHSDAVERAAEAHDRMAELVLRGGDVDDLAAGVVEVLAGACAVIDVDGRMLASTGDVGAPAAVADAVAAARSLGRTVQRGSLWATVVSAGGESLCALVLRPADDLAPADLRILERAAVVTALLLLSRRRLAEAESRVRGELLDDLVSRPDTDPATVWERARRIGVDLAGPNAVLVLLGPAELRQRISAWAAAHAASHGGLAAYRDGCAVLLIPGADPSALAARLARDAGAAVGVPVTVGAAGPVHAPGDVAPAHREAARCAAALVALGRGGSGACGADLGFVGLLLGGAGADGGFHGQDIDSYVTGVLGPVLDYDARRGTRLCETVEAYFACGASPARTAETLHVHVNTVAQRLERLTSLLGAGWQRPERALDLQLALRLNRLRAQGAGA
jgi:hypothetical protein